MFLGRVFGASVLVCAVLLPACSSSVIKDQQPDPSSLKCTKVDNPQSASGYALQPFCSPSDPGKGNIWFAASGEVLALTGYPFPPASNGDAAFVDGWDVRFTRLLTTIDKITLAENPDYEMGSQARTGKLVAEVDGPWAVDLSRSDPSYLSGKGGAGEQAVPLAALNSQNKNGGDAFATDGTRYAFGFDVIRATDQAQNVNLDPDALTDYESMVGDGCAVLYVGTATFKGSAKFDGCVTDDERLAHDLELQALLQVTDDVRELPNPDNDPAEAFPNEEHQRGIAFLNSSSVVGQVTLHTDHPFWDSVLHDSPAHFDQFAARMVGQSNGATVTLEDTRGVDYTAYTDSAGNAVNWRYCIEPPTDVHAKFTGPMRFDPQTVPHAPGNDAATGLRDYYDFATYNQSTQGHLNSDGLCYVQRNYPSPG